MAAITGKRPSSSSDLPHNKKARLFAREHEEERPQIGAKVDLTYGQRGAFPGLDEDGEEELFYGPADDGLAYLRMVRLEAKGVPNLLVAPRAAGIVEDHKDEKLYSPYKMRGEGWYFDGAYTAAPTATAAQELDDQEDEDPQEAFYVTLLHRFENLRNVLSSSSPYASSKPVEAALRCLMSDPKPRHWKHALLKSKPTPFLLSSLPQESVILGIEQLDALFTVRNLQGGIRQKLGVWAWGLLGKCRGVSEMGSEDVSVLRGLGKKACALSRKLQTRDPATENDEEEEEHDAESNVNVGAVDEVDVGEADSQTIVDAEVSIETSTSLEDAKRGLLAILDSDGVERGGKDGNGENGITESGKNANGALEQVSDTHATLDMIITIVGECYGQRDLLDGRLAWEEL